MGGFTCCVPGCNNNSSRDKGVGFHSFPKDQRLRELWIAKVGRTGDKGPFSKFVPTTSHKVCGVHFEGGRKTYMTRVPTVFPHITRSKKPKVRRLRQPVATPQATPFQNAVHGTREALLGVVDYPFQNTDCIKEEVVDEATDLRFQSTAYIKEEVVDEAADSRFQNTACIRQEVVDQAEDNPCSTQLCHWCQDVLAPVPKADKGTGTTFVRRNEVGTQTKPMPLCSNEPQVEVSMETRTPLTTCSTLADDVASTRSHASAEPRHNLPSALPVLPHVSSYYSPPLVPSPASEPGFMDILSSWSDNLQGRQRCHNNGVDVEDNKKHVIFESFLLSLFRSCGTCHQPCKAVVAVSDAGATVATECGNGHRGSWTTEPSVGWTNNH